MNRLPLLVVAAWLVAMPAVAAPAHDFPTVDRVLFVQDCMRAHPGPYYEMVNKCSCAIDRIADQLRHEDYVEMTTVANAMSIGGERGSEFRDNETVKKLLPRWRDLQARARQACFIGPPPGTGQR